MTFICDIYCDICLFIVSLLALYSLHNYKNINKKRLVA